jgi:hypothetical protein
VQRTVAFLLLASSFVGAQGPAPKKYPCNTREECKKLEREKKAARDAERSTPAGKAFEKKLKQELYWAGGTHFMIVKASFDAAYQGAMAAIRDEGWPLTGESHENGYFSFGNQKAKLQCLAQFERQQQEGYTKITINCDRKRPGAWTMWAGGASGMALGELGAEAQTNDAVKQSFELIIRRLKVPFAGGLQLPT